MSTDRELLELAAKAAGLDDAEWQDMEGWGEVRHGFSHAVWSKTLNEAYGTGYWNPLTDDGDALRLAVKLGLVVDFSRPSAALPFTRHSYDLSDGGNNAETARRAIVRAAAEIGKDKP